MHKQTYNLVFPNFLDGGTLPASSTVYMHAYAAHLGHVIIYYGEVVGNHEEMGHTKYEEKRK